MRATTWSAKAIRSRPSRSSSSSNRMPSSGSPPVRAATKRSTLSISARPSRSRTVSASICSTAARDDLVEHRFGVTHAAGGALRDDLEGLVCDGSAFGFRDAAQLGQDLLFGERPEGEALESRDDGRADAARIRRAEDEQDVGRRLLERLQQDVPALLDALDLVDDEDLLLEVGGRGVDARQQLAHVVDAVVATRRPARRRRAHGRRGWRRSGRSVSSGSPSTGLRQFTALATMRAVLVLPVPRGPTKRRPWEMRSSRTALRNVSMTASWAITSANVCARQRR